MMRTSSDQTRSPCLAVKLTALAFALQYLTGRTSAFTLKPLKQSSLNTFSLNCVADESYQNENIVRDSCGWRTDRSEAASIGPREARILMPLATMMGVTLSTFPNLSNANAEGTGSFMTAIEKYFPSAMTSRRTADRVIMTLRERGYTSSNTLLGASVCSDEINISGRIPKCLYNELTENCGNKAFTLGGLAGVPFVGKSGLAACVGHVPDQGKLIILFAPHLGISELGEVGPIRRYGKTSISNACGAAIGAYKLIKAQLPFESKQYDEEEAFIVRELSKRLEGVTFTEDMDPIAFVTYQMFCVVRDVLFQEIRALPSIAEKCSEVALLGGVIINQFDNDDYFQPLSFQVGKKDYFTEKINFVDIYEGTFGAKPGGELTAILGSKARAGEVLKDMNV